MTALAAWLAAGARGIRIERTVAIELTEDAPTAAPRDALRAAALAMTDATPSADAPTRLAVAVWRGLLAGAWRLLDSFDHDERWYLVARRCGADEHHPPVTEREEQVLALAARGHANKFIGYELGLSASTVATHLRRGLDKLGVPSRTALIAAAPIAALAAGQLVDEMTMDR